jgi:succinyl-diaminopimelate desuccinylase
MDEITLSQKLIRCQSVTPVDDGAIGVIISYLSALGFKCHDLTFTGDNSWEVRNLYARFGMEGPNFCFAGHTDVVPVGDVAAWKHPPFAAEIENGILYGRGTVDMKTSIAAFMVAVKEYIASGDFKGSISFLITGDEEADATNGTPKVLKWMEEHDETIDFCLIGEPTCKKHFGDTILNGRRGSINFDLEVNGKQGHIAYPNNFHNPIDDLVKIATHLKATKLDAGNDNFEPSNLEFTDLHVGNTATNVVPNRAKAKFNIRFNDMQSQDSLESIIHDKCQEVTSAYNLQSKCHGDAFICQDANAQQIIIDSVAKETGISPEVSTFGGTSDGRFIKNYCPKVMEMGMMVEPAHQVDEHVEIKHITQLKNIYNDILKSYFKSHV